ncbi:thiamine pyrophosphate-binding protein [Aureimonas fodinaquatilis]|uniref:Thiamine pyrophosphate-binding protein n=1 Tax=Aureimonas fodinaquatilis TaxID=2565783 RepID=A0A5B0DTK9_9HYPH|nr:thiamine pyrophosphate-dependent enzyme [Aureimonas fodinaquatilis]KAA0968519.1 thiamine pyrophosphate-binding protein [Aureimonas fodinaquatilis]
MKRSGGQILVDCLSAQGITHVFGVPGESYLAVLDAFYDCSPQIRFVNTRNEGGASFMAEAHGKLTGQPGIAFVTRGPGATNASIGIHAAMQASTPMILFIGQIPMSVRGREAFQEVDYRAYFGPLAKWVTEIEDVERIPEIMSRAFATALSGRPGPVVVALPENVLSDMADVTPGRKVIVPEPAPAPAEIAQIAERLGKAERPLILAGGSRWTESGRNALHQFASANGLPVASAFRFNDLFDNHSQNYIGEAGIAMAPHVQKMIREADVILACGVRFGEMTTGDYSLFSAPDTPQFLIHAHAADSELGKIYQANLPVHSGPNTLFAALADQSLALSPGREAWRASGRDAFVAALECPQQPGPVDMAAVMAHLRQILPDDVIVTNGAGNFATWPGKFLPLKTAGRLLAPQSGAMGYGLPAAVAAKLAAPERLVLCFAGDGDFQMNIQELATASQSGAAPVVLVLNNGTYGTIRMHQERHFPGRVSATDLSNPDFVKLAQAFGFHSERVDTTAGFAAAFDRATAAPNGAVLELIIDKESLTPRQTLSQIRAAAMQK